VIESSKMASARPPENSTEEAASIDESKYVLLFVALEYTGRVTRREHRLQLGATFSRRHRFEREQKWSESLQASAWRVQEPKQALLDVIALPDVNPTLRIEDGVQTRSLRGFLQHGPVSEYVRCVVRSHFVPFVLIEPSHGRRCTIEVQEHHQFQPRTYRHSVQRTLQTEIPIFKVEHPKRHRAGIRPNGTGSEVANEWTAYAPALPSLHVVC
jgi:hypothetical protein